MKNIFGLILILATFPAQASLHKWVDSNGKIHYSDTVPADAKQATILKLRGESETESGTPQVKEKSLAEKELENKRTQQNKEAEAKKAEIEKEQAEIKQTNCANAKSNLINLEKSPRIVTYNENGDREFMSDVTRNQQMDEAKKAISQNCN